MEKMHTIFYFKISFTVFQQWLSVYCTKIENSTLKSKAEVDTFGYFKLLKIFVRPSQKLYIYKSQ